MPRELDAKTKARFEKHFSAGAAKEKLAQLGPVAKAKIAERYAKREQAWAKAGLTLIPGAPAGATLGVQALLYAELTPDDQRAAAEALGHTALAFRREVQPVLTADGVDALNEQYRQDDIAKGLHPDAPVTDRNPDPESLEAGITESYDQLAAIEKERSAGPRKSAFWYKGDRWDGLANDLVLRRKSGEGLAGLSVQGELAAEVRREVTGDAAGGEAGTQAAIEVLFNEISPPSSEGEQ